jgi:HemK-like putative methylase
MPRLAPSLLHHASRKNPLLPILLRECRDTRSAKNEYRWLKEHALALQSSPNVRAKPSRRKDAASVQGWRTTLRKLVGRRAKGEPLQYILGTQPFGDLEILCKRGVLIPRPETEAYTDKLAELVLDLSREETAPKRQKLRILDLCTGTGCISLLLHSLLKPPHFKQAVGWDASDSNPFVDTCLEILGIDISNTALTLAKKNLHHNSEQGALHPSAKHDVSFARADVLRNRSCGTLSGRPGNELHRPVFGPVVASVREVLQRGGIGREWDIVISNPPYISPSNYSPGGTTSRSVRRWEPQPALVPQPLHFYASQHVQRLEYENQLQRGDEFYSPLLELARSVGSKAIALEVGDGEQARRVQNFAAQYFVTEPEIEIEIWRDDGTVHTATSDPGFDDLESGCRAVVVWRSSWAKWRKGRMNIRR